jgi:transposase-like protein
MDIYEISQKFPDEISAYDYLEKIRWSKKRVCTKCKTEHTGKRLVSFNYFCSKCRSQFSVINGTYLHNTRLPLQKWFMAFAVVTDAKKGISAHQLKRNIGVTYVTAFKMAHLIRDMMAEEKVDVLTDVVEMDETYIGGKPRKPNVKALLTDKGKKYLIDRTQEIAQMGFDLRALKGNTAQVDLNTKRGRGSQKLVSVTGIVQRDGAVVAEVMSSLGAKKLQDLVEKHVQTDSALLITDTYKGYARMKKIIEHIKIDHSKLYSYNGVNTNTIESFWAIVERGIMGTYHHVTLKYLPKYVVEFCFKYNNRNYDDMFDTLVKASMNVKIDAPIIHDPNKVKRKRKIKEGNLGAIKPLKKIKPIF